MTTLQEDSSTPAVLRRGPGTSGTATCASFTPPAKSYVLVLINWLWSTSTGGVVSVHDNHGNTFASLQELTNNNGSNGASYQGAFGFYYSSAPGSTTVTASCTKLDRASVQLAVRVLTGADSDQTGAAHVWGAGYNINVTPSIAGSAIYMVGGVNQSASPSVRSDCTSIDSWTSLVNSQSGTRQYHVVSSATYYGSDASGGNANGQRTGVGSDMYQGGETDSGGSFNGTMKSLGILSGNPQADLSGKGIDSVSIRLNNEHSWYGSGLTVDLGYTNRTSLPSSWNGSDIQNIKEWNQAEGANVTTDISGLGFGNALATGAAKSITLGPGSGSFNLNYYGWFTGSGGDSSTYPLITVNWGLDTNVTGVIGRRTALTGSTSPVTVGWTGTVQSIIAVEIQPATSVDVTGSASASSVASGALTLSGYLVGTATAVSRASGTMPFTFSVSGLSYTPSWAQVWFAKVLFLDGRAVASSGAGGWTKPPAPFAYPPAGSQDVVTATLFDNNLVAQMPIPFVSLTATLYYNQVGSWSIVAPYSATLWNRVMAGDVIVEINWRGLFTFGGKCEQPGYTNSLPGARQGGSGGVSAPGPFMILSGSDYLALIANRIAYPAPGLAWASQTAGSTDAVSSVKCETAIKHYVNLNVGAGAISSRVMSLLDIGTDLARGGTVSYTVKFAQNFSLNLMDIIRTLIGAAGSPTGMGVSVKRNGKRLLFDVYVPRNLANKAWFSQTFGNLTSVNLSVTDPTCTDALVRGSSAFISRIATARTNWNVVEQYTDNSSETDANNLAATAQTALLTGAAGPTLNATPTDSPFLTFGRDYYLGDIVTVEVVPGASYSDVVSSVSLAADPSQNPAYSVIPNLGRSADATATDSTIIGQLTARIRSLEKRLSV